MRSVRSARRNPPRTLSPGTILALPMGTGLSEAAGGRGGRGLRGRRGRGMTVAVGVVGLGYWGPNLARNFGRCRAGLAWLCDGAEDHLARVAPSFPGARPTKTSMSCWPTRASMPSRWPLRCPLTPSSPVAPSRPASTCSSRSRSRVGRRCGGGVAAAADSRPHADGRPPAPVSSGAGPAQGNGGLGGPRRTCTTSTATA